MIVNEALVKLFQTGTIKIIEAHSGLTAKTYDAEHARDILRDWKNRTVYSVNAGSQYDETGLLQVSLHVWVETQGIPARFISVWDNGEYKESTPCMVDLESGRVYNIEPSDTAVLGKTLTDECIEFNVDGQWQTPHVFPESERPEDGEFCFWYEWESVCMTDGENPDVWYE